ncbi:desmoglein-2 [Bombina bombina]|uniref:desmoglein-2 n=1 Tax=Bombina bombina TaxID=8345 RepID=UPI00235A900F|nr:desmoglein-2 [Bombina bombina]
MPWTLTAGRSFLFLLMFAVGIGDGLHLEILKQSKSNKANLASLVRNKREWVIPPVSIVEEQDNSRKNPIARIQSDHQIEFNKRITYKITGKGVTEPPYGLFIINERNGELNVTGIVDRETTPIFFLKGYALDMDGKDVEPPIDLRVKVIDINDNNPVFTQEVFVGTVEELSSPNTLVLRLNATDADEENTINSKLAFRILSQEPGQSQLFIINKDTGEVRTTVSNLDREQQSSYSLVLEVKDRGGEQIGLSSKCVLKIKVKDVNDNIPRLEKEAYEGSVEENVANVEILRMKAFDDDEEFTDNWWANFTIVSGNEDGYFEVVTDTATNEGVLMIVKEADYEELQNIELSVVVSNRAEYHSSIISSGGGGGAGGAGGGAGGGKRIPIKVKVKNVPEGPVFKPKRKKLVVSEGKKVTIGQIIGSYQAFDGDTGKVAENVKYAKEYDPDNWFIIDSTTAEIKLSKIPDRESAYVVNGTYIAKILAISEVLPGKTATGTIAIEVEDVNDNCPIILEPIRTICDNSKFVNVTAVDRDSFPFGAPLTFIVVDVPVGTAKNWEIGKKDDVSVQLIPKAIWPGSHKVQVLVTDNEGLSCPEMQILELAVCDCEGGDACSSRRIETSVGLGAGAIGLMILACILLLLVPLLLLLCYCGKGKGFIAVPDGTEASFVKWNNEGAEPEDMATAPQPIVISGFSGRGAGAGAAGKGDSLGFQGNGGYEYNANQTYNANSMYERRFEGSRELLTAGEIARRGAAGNTIKSLGVLGAGSGSGAGAHGNFRGGDAGGSMAALNEDFIRGYFQDKAFAYADEDDAEPAKDCILLYSQEEYGSCSGSVGCCSFIESDIEENFLDDLGLKFKALAEVCMGCEISTGVQVDSYRSYEAKSKIPSREMIETEARRVAEAEQFYTSETNVNTIVPEQSDMTIENSYSSAETKFHTVEPEVTFQETVVSEESFAPVRFVNEPMLRGGVLVTEKSYTTGPMLRLEPVRSQNVLVTERVIRPASSLHNLIDVADGQNVLVTEHVIQSDAGMPNFVSAGDFSDNQYMVVRERVLAPNSNLQASLSIPDLSVGQNVLVTERHYTPISTIQSKVVIPTDLSSGESTVKESIAVKEGEIQGRFVNTPPLINQGAYLVEELPSSSNSISSIGKSTSRVTKYSNVQYTRS